MAEAESMEVVLARIDERTKGMACDLDELTKTVSRDYVTKEAFRPVQKIVWGGILAILVAFGGALIGMVIQEKPNRKSGHHGGKGHASKILTIKTHGGLAL